MKKLLAFVSIIIVTLAILAFVIYLAHEFLDWQIIAQCVLISFFVAGIIVVLVMIIAIIAWAIDTLRGY